MSMKKLSKKMLAVVAAGAMTMGLAMPAFAAGAGEETTKVTKAYISKTYNTEVGKAMEFKFTATQNTADADVVKSEVACTIPSISFIESETGTTKKVSSSEIKFAPFTEEGKYEYTVKEKESNPVINDSANEKLIMSKAEYKMDVYVVENPVGTFKVDQIVVNKTKNDKGADEGGKVDISGDQTKNTFNFVNTYVQEAGTGTDPTTPDPDYKKNGALKVSKTIDAQGETPSTTDSFSFTAKFIFPEGTDATTLGGVKGNGKDVTLTEGAYTFTLKHEENMKFTGLPVGTKITVTEAGAANYKGSASVVLNGGDAKIVAAGKYHEDLTAVDGNKDKLGQNKNTVDVTNTYNHVPTTGIIMNTLPYVLMIALCGAALFGFVAFKRRR
ncbi:hypothetical protein DW762_13310 [Ruminococcus sp. AM29-19LB]|nr:hypothetical protein DWX54_13215 [Ruminococcus sp. AF19-4LB]RGH68807.1 hypothetical protein DW772_11565 [Ruminococcus sp. AM29-5AC]RGH71019.1 hypothetical protein DW764_12980 [Ruminococcus sp. AM29-1LB]RGH75360.1 hypothetical protein DW762_13310 [Ruminococcus sp. AM29-19LB]RGH77825.1 hypothetical protein DW755_13085 [Ruminococcus sp. AM29-10LB]RGH78897.1 hypothetical protein DW752_12980 [Ruminococcus sp. AM29-1]